VHAFEKWMSLSFQNCHPRDRSRDRGDPRLPWTASKTPGMGVTGPLVIS
jgi:hypothetical protein